MTPLLFCFIIYNFTIDLDSNFTPNFQQVETIHELEAFQTMRVFRLFLNIVLNASRSRNAFKCVHFPAFSMDPSNFLLKIHEFSTLGAKCYRDVTKSVPNTKIHTFCKVLPGRGQNANFDAFSKGIDRRFSRVLAEFAFFNNFWTSFWTLPGRAMLPNAANLEKIRVKIDDRIVYCEPKQKRIHVLLGCFL